MSWKTKHRAQKSEIKHRMISCISSNCSPIATVFLLAQLLVSLLLSWIYIKGTPSIISSLDNISSFLLNMFVCLFYFREKGEKGEREKH